MSAALTMNSTPKDMPFDTVMFDPNDNFDTANYEYTVPITGYYQIGLMIGANPIAAAKFSTAALHKDTGAGYAVCSYMFQGQNQAAASVAFHQATSVLLKFNAGDKLKIVASSNGTTNAFTNTEPFCKFSGRLVSL